MSGEKMSEKLGSKSFFERLKKTEKYKDLFFTIEGKLALVLSVILAYIFYCVLINKTVEEFNDILFNISIAMIACLISLLGITLASLAFVISVMSKETIKNLADKGEINTIDSILFTFYFLGWIIAIGILIYIIILALSLSLIPIYRVAVYVMGLIAVYVTLFIIFYTVSLCDTCINMFYVNFIYSKDNREGK